MTVMKPNFTNRHKKRMASSSPKLFCNGGAKMYGPWVPNVTIVKIQSETTTDRKVDGTHNDNTGEDSFTIKMCFSKVMPSLNDV